MCVTGGSSCAAPLEQRRCAGRGVGAAGRGGRQFILARAAGSLDEASDGLFRFARVVEGDLALREAVANPALPLNDVEDWSRGSWPMLTRRFVPSRRERSTLVTARSP